MNDILTPEFVSTVLTVCVIPLLGILTKYLVTYIQKLVDTLETKANCEQADQYLLLAQDAIVTAVTAVSQTYVDALKKQDAFDAAAQAQAFAMAKAQALTIMGAAAQEALKLAMGDFDKWVDAKIEYYVSQSK